MLGASELFVGEIIPQAAPMRRIARHRRMIDTALACVLDGSHAIAGPELEAFEARFAAFCTRAHCVGVGSGTDALLIALRAADIGPGDEVITVALTAAGTAQAISLCGATPVFVDVDPISRCMAPAAAQAAIGPRTAAILPVHLFGFPADMHSLARLAERHGLFLLEDCAQAHGATLESRKLGSFGHAAAFSFYLTKNLGCIGDGGAIVTADPALAERMRSMRNFGWQDGRRISQHIAGNSRLDELQAAVLSVLLPHLEAENQERRALAGTYLTMLDDLGGLPADNAGAVWHQFAIEHDDRDGLARHLHHHGIGTSVHYYPPLHHQPAFAGANEPHLPVTEALSARLLSLPIQPEAVGSNLNRIVGVVHKGAFACRQP